MAAKYKGWTIRQIPNNKVEYFYDGDYYKWEATKGDERITSFSLNQLKNDIDYQRNRNVKVGVLFGLTFIQLVLIVGLIVILLGFL